VDFKSQPWSHEGAQNSIDNHVSHQIIIISFVEKSPCCVEKENEIILAHVEKKISS